MVVTLDSGAGDPVLEWANGVIAAHPNHNVIVVTHAYMQRDGSKLDSTDGCAAYKNGANDPLYNTEIAQKLIMVMKCIIKI